MDTSLSNDFIPITQCSRELLELTGNPGPGYRRLLVLAADAKITPPMQQRSSRWGCLRRDIPALAAALGLPVTSRAPGSRKAAAHQAAA